MKKLNALIFTLIALTVTNLVQAQESLLNDTNYQQLESRVSKAESDLAFWKKLKVNGWIQAQYQQAETKGEATVAGGNFAAQSYDRFILRRGRIKFTYEQGIAQYVLQLDVIDPTLTAPLPISQDTGTKLISNASATSTIPFAVNVRDFFVKVNMPFFKPLSMTTGMQNRPFGFEVSQTSQYRETPERSRFVQMCFPNERDLGVMFTLQAPNTSPLHAFKINAGLFNGSGIAREFDSKKDFIGQLMYNSATRDEKISYGIGVSYYYGGTVQTDQSVYSTFKTINADSAVAVVSKSVNNIGAYAKREYLGIDAQVSIDNIFGITTLRGEYAQGYQPGTASSSRAFEIAPTSAMYVRPFNAGYFYFVHKIVNLPIQLVFKYDFYDPNTKVSGKQIESTYSKFGVADIKYTTNGFGINYLVSNNLKFMFYYDQITNETTRIKGYTTDLKDNVLTCRVQYRF